MIETTYSQARAQLKALMDRAVADREVIMVRRRGAEAVAIIAADELEGLMETAHLLRSPGRARARSSPSPLRPCDGRSGLKTEPKRLAVFQPEFNGDSEAP